MAKEETKKEEKVDEAAVLGVKGSRIVMTGFKDKDPTRIAKEAAKHETLSKARIEKRVAKAKKDAKMKPIEKRKALLASRFKAVRARVRPNNYTNKMIEAWTEEFELIRNNPKQWNKITNNGTKNFTPGNKKKMTAKEKLDNMNLDED